MRHYGAKLAQKTTIQPLTHTEMATTKGTRSALMMALEEISDYGLRHGEFSLRDFVEEAKAAGKTVTQASAKVMLARMVDDGRLLVRKTCIDGRIINAYSKP